MPLVMPKKITLFDASCNRKKQDIKNISMKTMILCYLMKSKKTDRNMNLADILSAIFISAFYSFNSSFFAPNRRENIVAKTDRAATAAKDRPIQVQAASPADRPRMPAIKSR